MSARPVLEDAPAHHSGGADPSRRPDADAPVGRAAARPPRPRRLRPRFDLDAAQVRLGNGRAAARRDGPLALGALELGALERRPRLRPVLEAERDP